MSTDALAWVEILPEPVLLVSGDSGVIAANKAARLLLQSVCGHVPNALIDVSPEIGPILARARRVAGMQPSVIPFLRPDGSTQSVRCSMGRARPSEPCVLVRLAKPEVGRRLDQLNQRLRDTENEVRRRRRAEAELRSSQAWLKGILTYTPVGILVTEQDRVVFANDRASDWASDDVPRPGSPIPPIFRDLVAEARRTGLHVQHEVVLGDRHGLATAFPTAGPDDAQAFGVVCSDMTRIRQAETARADIERKMLAAQKLESLGVLAGGIAHDFNNLLVGVLGNAALARQDLDPQSPVQECLADVELAAQRAADLCRQLLAYSGKGRFVVEPLDVTEVIREMLHLVRLSVSKRAMVRPILAANLPRVEADATQLRQVFLNLITNASDALEDQDGLITVSTSDRWLDRHQLADLHGSDLDPGHYVIVEVSDTGSGMDEATLERIFDPFFTTKFTGRGLGLAAVIGIIRGHRGAIRVYSEPGRGTLFRLVLPCASEAVPPAPAPAPPSPARGTTTILVVDDEGPVRMVARRTLERAGFEVIEAEDGVQAVEIFRENHHRIDGVLLDLMMPGLSGAEVLAEIRRLAPKIRIVMSSGYNEQEVISSFAGRGLAGFLQKPWSPAELVRMLATDDTPEER